ncbi:putative CheA signal transduction histidine kinase [Hyella patelloides LEGE 07179]|uniref:Putative CheA signal transduction histidine kinase n=1 Tax=Hyella patelloides LEGE 07179 TaxID=945734 RepID=A0A563W438_9CYAN|nr:Hpt domain-containing protein [Hyella patelloides]VEP18444.1 putative CheA signal transduction histidine kinase [Hyella patelloides LEGE 07179]
MDIASQQRILGYFIEEAKEHLQTLEQGILQLGTSSQDTEMVNEMFRAAHSVKGGAAMLGYSSIQKTAHRLEDSFKILKENSIPVDQKLESLFLGGYDCLQDLIERLENSAEFKDEDAVGILEQAESNFVNLHDYLQELLAGGGGAGDTVNFADRVKETLKKMLQLFKQPDNEQNRQQIQGLCQSLSEIAPEEANWQKFVKIATQATSNRKYPYNTVAQIIIKEIKQAGDLLSVSQASKIVPSKNLQQLAATAAVSNDTAAAKVMIPKDVRGAAIALLKNFNKTELTQIVKILSSKL